MLVAGNLYFRMACLTEALATAIAHHEAGRLELAEQIYRQILAAEPNHAQVSHLAGLVAHQRGQHARAMELIRRAIALDGRQAHFHNNLGEVCRAVGRFDEACDCYRQALGLNPCLAQVHSNLGEAYREQGRLDQAIACYRQALEINPRLATAWNNLGIAQQDRKELDSAVASYQQAIAWEPGYAKAHTNLASAWIDRHRPTEAVACYRRAVQLAPDFAPAHYGLGNVLKDLGCVDEAEGCLRRAIQLQPDLAEAYCNLSGLLVWRRRLDEALDCGRRAIELKPDLAEAQVNLGNAWKDQGDLAEALACYQKAAKLKPDWPLAQSNLAYSLWFSPEADLPAIAEAHRCFSRQHAEPLAHLIRPHGNDRSPDRRLRVGYMSPNLREHVVGWNLLPLFQHHDRRQFEVLCYADVPRPDPFSRRLQACADAWRPTAEMTDEQLAEQIRADQIDILVDLALHMSGNRLLVFARRPAPVQVTFAGYPATTGLSTIGYRLTDPQLDPPGLDDRYYSERSIRLTHSFWCYAAPESDPPVSGLPALEQGFVTFGCLANPCKINARVLRLWARVLRAVDGSRLLLLAPSRSSRQRTCQALAVEGVSAERVEFVDSQAREAYLNVYHRIDVGLDTLPYNGHNTSLDSFWMGVPVVTLAGQTVVGRAGVSQLTNLSLPQLIAHTPDRFVAITTELASDLPRLAKLRRTLRHRMQSSPLMDAPSFAHSIEAAYRTMWHAEVRGEG